MASTQPTHRFPEAKIGSYRTRLLLGYALSLGTLLLFFNLPAPSASSAEWLLPSPPERILVSQIQETSPEDDDASSAEDDEAAPLIATETLPRFQSSSSASESDDPRMQEEGSSSGDASSTDTPPKTQQVTSLTDIKQPEIVGGRGAFYLQIQYPEAARQEGIEGELRLHFFVNEEGMAERIQVEKSLHPLTDTAAVRALRSVRFRPALDEGEPVPVWMSLPVRFRLVDSTDARAGRTGLSDPSSE